MQTSPPKQKTFVMEQTPFVHIAARHPEQRSQMQPSKLLMWSTALRVTLLLMPLPLLQCICRSSWYIHRVSEKKHNNTNRCGQMPIFVVHRIAVWSLNCLRGCEILLTTENQLVFFTARLHVMQRTVLRRLCCPSVCPSVCQTRGMWQNKRTVCPRSYTTSQNFSQCWYLDIV